MRYKFAKNKWFALSLPAFSLIPSLYPPNITNIYLGSGYKVTITNNTKN